MGSIPDRASTCEYAHTVQASYVPLPGQGVMLHHQSQCWLRGGPMSRDILARSQKSLLCQVFTPFL